MTALEAVGILSCLLLAGMLGVALFNLATAPRLERAGEPRWLPRVSVLVPARNEGATLRETLPGLLAMRYDDVEILVLDDQSEDDTAAVVAELARHDGRLRLIRGAPLPDGWLGKNWACHQLSREAGGDVLLFCDADVSAHPDALARTVSLLARAGAVTAIPRQTLDGWFERAVVPLVVQLPVVAMLPLRAVRATRSPSISMANGQWLAFRRTVYTRIGGHVAVRGEVVEDVELGRLVKQFGAGRLVPALAPELLSVRMYSGARAVREGFRKNLYPLLGGHPLPFAAGVATFLLVGVYPWLGAAMGAPWALPALTLLLAVRVVAALCCGADWRTVALHPAGAPLALGIAADSFLAHLRGTPRWKGRDVAAPARSDTRAAASPAGIRVFSLFPALPSPPAAQPEPEGDAPGATPT